MNGQEPAYFAEVRNRLVGAQIRQMGLAENWLAPTGLYYARSGFGEETWMTSSDTLIAWRRRGGEIESLGGATRGARGMANRRLVTLQVKGTPSHYRAQSAVSFGHFVIPDALLARVASDLGFAGPPTDILREDLAFFADDILFGALEDYAGRASAQRDQPSRVEMEARALLIVERLLNVHHRPRPRERGGLAPYALRRVTDYLMAQLAEDVSLAELAAIADLSPHHFCRAFRQSTGLPPHAWLTARRIEQAQDLMAAHPKMGLTEIALCVGYRSQAAFAVAFKRTTGLNPSQWRRERAG